MPLTVAHLRGAAAIAAATFRAREDELNAADAKLGDGDTGLMLRRLFETIEAASSSPCDDLGRSASRIAAACAKSTGSSLGTLVTISALTLAKRWKGCVEVPWNELGPALILVRDAMMARGGAGVGDKTVIDSLDAVASALDGCNDAATAASRAAAASSKALDVFRNRPSRIGRARMFADRSKGLDDPGMLAFAQLTQSLSDQPAPLARNASS